MKKILFLLCLFLVAGNVYSQKYIKYFFLDNEFRILVEKNLKKTTDRETITGFFYDEDAFVGFANKRKTIKMIILVKNQMDMQNYIVDSWLSNNNDNVKVNLDRVDDQKTIIERRSEVFYEAILVIAYKEGIAEVKFRAPAKKYNKWSPVVKDMFNSVEIKSR